MSKQYFKVGELVVICSKLHPKYNNCITKIIESNYNEEHGYGYKLQIGIPIRNWWCQHALRKHYPPSTQSFDEIMKELKGPVKA